MGMHVIATLLLRLFPLVPLVAVLSLFASPDAQASRQPNVCRSSAPLEGQLNINTATEAQWQLLPGIGPSTAGKIIRYRERHGFRRLTQLLRVKGIGKKTFARMKPFLSLAGDNTLHFGAR